MDHDIFLVTICVLPSVLGLSAAISNQAFLSWLLPNLSFVAPRYLISFPYSTLLPVSQDTVCMLCVPFKH